MPGWKEEYLTGIIDADRRNPIDPREVVAACSLLADRVSALEAEKAVLQSQSDSRRPSISKGAPLTDPNTDDSALIARLRFDLAEALRAKGQFQNKLQTAEKELSKLQSKTTADTRTIRELTTERKKLTTRLRDREDELRAKNKLVADVQDELAVLNLQLNVVEKRRKEKEEENKQLVERYMERVGQEADAMNRANKW